MREEGHVHGEHERGELYEKGEEGSVRRGRRERMVV